MAQVIIFSNSNGGVSVCIPTGELDIEVVKAKDTPSHSIIVEDSALPQADNDFFGAWELADGAVTVNLDKAKEITKTRLRTEREPLLAAQDVLYMRAIESNADTTAIVAEKQRLRDITSGVEACTTTAELRGLSVTVIAPVPTPEPQMPPSNSVTFETIELDENKENLLLKVACGLVGAPVIASVDDAYGNCQQFEGVLDETGRFSFSASLSNINDGPLQLVALINYGEIQTELTFELSRGA